MDVNSQRSRRRDDVLSSLNMVIGGLDVAESLTSITPAEAVFRAVSVLLAMMRELSSTL